MKWILSLLIVFGLTLGGPSMTTSFAKDKGNHGGKSQARDHGGQQGKQQGKGQGMHRGSTPQQAVHVKHGPPAKVHQVQPARVSYRGPQRVQYVTTGKPRFYSPYYLYSPRYLVAGPVGFSSGFFSPYPKVLVSPTIFTPTIVEPTVPTYYFFPPLYVPPRSLFSLNIGL